MITSKIAANQTYAQVNQLNKGDSASQQKSGHEEVIKTSQGETIDGIKAEISAFSINASHQFNAEFNAVVKSIRIADKAMGEIEANVEQMESEVEMFIKQYPPYPPGSDERVKYLSRFAMLRKQIDQLTIPPDIEARSIIGEPRSGESSDWEIKIGGEKIGQTIRHQPFHTGEDGLALPEISLEASDEQIAGLKKALGSARQQIKQRRAEFAQDAIQVIRSVQ
jgi:hypothetical protein